MARPSVAVEVLGLWQAAEDATRKLQAQWPAVQELMVGVATTHQQLQAAAADITASAVTAALQAARMALGAAASEAVVVAAATSSAVAAVAAVAPLAQKAAAAAAAAAATPGRQKGAAELAAGDVVAGYKALEGLRKKRTKVSGCDRSD
jgi:hypothetical protein